MSYVLDQEAAQHAAGCSCRLCDPFRPARRGHRAARPRQTAMERLFDERARADALESELAELRAGPDADLYPPFDPAELAYFLDSTPPEVLLPKITPVYAAQLLDPHKLRCLRMKSKRG